ncbi:HWE histidine kinase domain-containing protein [Alteraurantiacibacter aquimixticola]|uniref:histidine kinase n=1 Tax=Alteraurantiacibacter aquimixticola TaxID=2489173 RepID=A0A4T3F362_9SPHN|nr:HWE histidine kinase domain-containing protein [Alteraurantiacibacter aquimixticola]TIX51653.1 hybrid sensor histidine kinase/response regulator [Alteraurantiacibacter aquimixticola]
MNVDLSNCDREPIHLLGHVQSFGCLLAVSSDWIVLHASRNVEDHLGLPAEQLIGQPLRDRIAPDGLHAIRGRLQTLYTDDAIERLYGLELIEGDDRKFNVAIHISGAAIVLEVEPASDTELEKDHLSSVRGMIERLNAGGEVEEICHTATRFLRALCGFDRVMVYRFGPDDTGEVIAEAAAHHVDSFLGLRYPATDIPRQARELYKRSLIRIISDVDDEVSPIIPETNSEKVPLDLSLSTLRAVSPIHLEYLRNMGVKASMSISILHQGRLWGLFACHHYEPRVLDYSIRSACDLFGQMFSFVLGQAESERGRKDAEVARDLHDRLMRQLAEDSNISRDFGLVVEGLSELIPFDGAAGWINGNFQSIGVAPTKEEFLQLVKFLNTTATSRVFATDSLHKVFPPAEDYIERGAGLLALPVSRTPRDYIVLFRREVAKTVKWAGNPEKPVELGPNGVRLTPRKSFEAWKETVSGHCAEWTASELQVADAIRVTLLEVVLRMSDAANTDRTRAQERQELLIAELNHRVRNILNLIRGLVDQSRSETTSVADFTKTVSDRIHALARAHDQITKESWAASSLRELVKTEVEAYLADKGERVHFNGIEAIIKPEAFSTLALVIHELTTNSAKYGALSDSSGTVAITLSREADDALTILWEERNGPPVKPPLRRGFGSTVIDRSIPFELGGQAEVNYPLTGLTARFVIPSRHIERFEYIEGGKITPDAAPTVSASEPRIAGKALLVEDNMIIALDGEKLLRELGASEVVVASNVDEGLRLIDEVAPDFAVLDLNLGTQNSLPVAERLKSLGTPFAFATGYGDASALLTDFPDTPVVTKPYAKASLLTAIRSFF